MNKAPRRELITKDYDGMQSYGAVTKILGNGRMLVKMYVDIDSEIGENNKGEKQCTVRGSMRRREWVNMHDVVLVAFREFGDTHDIIRKYSDAEVAELRRLGELTIDAMPKLDDDDCGDVCGGDAGVDIVFEDI